MKKLIVLHGWGQNSSYWAEFKEKFESIHVITIDLPGFGSEKLSDQSMGIPEYADWVKGKIESLGLDSTEDEITLLGHSFGGRIASYVVGNSMVKVDALILYGSPSIYRPSAKTLSKIRLYKLAKKLGLDSLFKNLSDVNEELEMADRSGLGKIFRNVVNFDQTEIVKNITVPTLLLWGKDDQEVKVSIALEMEKLIPKSILKVCEGYGHNLHVENATLFYGIVNKFIESLEIDV